MSQRTFENLKFTAYPRPYLAFEGLGKDIQPGPATVHTGPTNKRVAKPGPGSLRARAPIKLSKKTPV
ncbi:hypothetical protein J6590_067898, partial [Homalodisca vitripennis]